MPRSSTSSPARPRRSEADIRAELQTAHTAWAAGLGERESWRPGAAYLRESHEDSMQGYSPMAQLRHVLEEASTRKIFIPWEHVFVDNISGRHDRRPAFLDLMALARTRRIAALLVFHTSRFARNVGVSRRWKEELRRIGVEVLAGNLRDLDVTTPEGRLMETVQEAFDQYHSDSTGAWVVVGLRTKHEQGEPLGLLPETFYRQQVASSGEGVPTYDIRPHPELSRVVLEGAELYVARNSSGRRFGFGDLARWAAEQGHRTPSGRPLTDEWWRNTLSNPLNAGYVAYRRKQARARGGAELRPARHPGFLSPELFQQIQETRRANTRSGGRPPRTRVYLLSPMVCGECGGQVTACGNARYRCRVAADATGRCRQGSVSAPVLESAAGRWLVGALQVTPALEAECARIVATRTARTADASRAEEIRRRLARLGDRYEAGDPTLAREEYIERVRQIKVELAAAERVNQSGAQFDAMRHVRDLARLYERTTPEKRRDLWRFVFTRIVVQDKRIVRVLPNQLLMPLFEAALQQRSRPDSNRRSRP